MNNKNAIRTITLSALNIRFIVSVTTEAIIAGMTIIIPPVVAYHFFAHGKQDLLPDKLSVKFFLRSQGMATPANKVSNNAVKAAT